MIKITGGGTRKEIAKALSLISKSIKNTPVEDLDGSEWEDCTLMTEISIDIPYCITQDQVLEVSNSIPILLSISQIKWIQSCFEDSQRQDPQPEWRPIVEDLIEHMLDSMS